MARKKQRARSRTTTSETAEGDGTESFTPNHHAVAERAYRLYEKRGCVHGHDVEDWLEAERELRGEAVRELPSSFRRSK